MSERLIVIGADAAGMTAASQARRRNRNLEVIAFEKSGFASYAACGEPYYIAGDVDTIDQLVARTPEQFAKAGIDLRLHHEVTAIDIDSKTVEVHSHKDGTAFTETYDKLLIATGARAFIPPMPGVDLPGVHTLRTLDDAVSLRSITESHTGSIVIVGGGYIGIEVAEAFDTRGWRVTMVEALPSLMARTLDAELAETLTKKMIDHGIDVHTSELVERIDGIDKVTGVTTATETIAADVVVLAVGGRPVSELAKDAGIALGATGGIAVDDHQRTSVEDVYSAGDCAEVLHRVTGSKLNLHLGTMANKTGRIAGVNITGGDDAFPGSLGTAITRFHDLEIAMTGARLHDADAAGLDAVEVTVSGMTTSHYMPTASDMTIRLTAERGTGRILGAQIVGGPGAGKRIDVFATAIWNGIEAADFEWIDLAYAPPFAPVWDLMAIAARKAAAAARK